MAQGLAPAAVIVQMMCDLSAGVSPVVEQKWGFCGENSGDVQVLGHLDH